jgi:biotin carboxylase
MSAPRVLLLLPTTTYRARPFVEAARRLGVEVLVGSNRCHVLAELWPPAGSLILRFDEPGQAAAAIVAEAKSSPLDAILAVDDQATEIAALAADTLGLRHNSPAAARAARNKREMRDALARAGVPAPRHLAFRLNESPERAARAVLEEFGFPCVLKPLLLTASRGVMRADDEAELAAAWSRLGAILAAPDLRANQDPAAREVLVEEFVPGAEAALEGILSRGVLQVLALFDKPDPLNGPYFEETIYVTPSRLKPAVQDDIAAAAQRAAAALGLREGPVHAELRVNDSGPWVIEIAGRSIGGLCSRALRFGLGDISLEEAILRHALGMGLEPLVRVREASGVMMIPIPRAGVMREVTGIEAAEAVPGVTGVSITIRAGERVVPLPEGGSYLGFIFARGQSPAQVESALREACAELRFDIAPSRLIASPPATLENA